MLESFYTLAIRAYGLSIRFVGRRNEKARFWVEGRKSWKRDLTRAIEPDGPPWVWFHCASLGEFEQARNLIDEVYDHHPEFRILLTFFSPSGYRIRSGYTKCHHVAYLPLDTPENARFFLELTRPQFGIFVKYELWLNFLTEARDRQIPLALIAARPDPNSMTLKWPARKLFRKGYMSFQHIFTQDERSASLLTMLGHESVSVSADTRFDRVASNQSQRKSLPKIEQWLNGRTCLIAGSTWPTEEQMLMQAWEMLPEDNRPLLIIAPHEIHPHSIDEWIEATDGKAIRYKDIDQLSTQHQILWIDCIGLLSGLYAYGEIAYVGGAFDKGLHNILEAAVYGCSLVIGPKYSRFPEACDLISAGGCSSVNNASELAGVLGELLRNSELRKNKARINSTYVQERIGATEKILNWMQSEKWLIERND